jgi:hypothetical protein
MIAGTDGWILEKKSRNRFSNRGGDAPSRAVRSCAIAGRFYLRRPALTASRAQLASRLAPRHGIGFPQRPEKRDPADQKKHAELRKCAVRRSGAGGMIGAVAMATRTRG